MQILEAFRALNALNEDVFSLDADGIKGLSDFKNNDDFEDDISVIDPEAETAEDLQDNYIGKVILDCCVCHSKLYKAKEEVTIDETGELANVGEECPYCFTPDGFKVIGEVAAFEGGESEDELDELLDGGNLSNVGNVSVNLDGGENNDVDVGAGFGESWAINESLLVEGKIIDAIKKVATRVGADATTIVRCFAELSGSDKLYDMAEYVENKAVLKALMSGNEKVMNSLTKNDIEELKDDIAAYEKAKKSGKSVQDEKETMAAKRPAKTEGLFGRKKSKSAGKSEELFDVWCDDGKAKWCAVEGVSERDADYEVRMAKKVNSDVDGFKSWKVAHGTDVNEGLFDKKKSKELYDVWCDDGEERWLAYDGVDAKQVDKELAQAKKDNPGVRVYKRPHKSGKVNESIDDFSITANDTHVEATEDESGRVTVTMEPVTADGGEMIAPVSDETEAELMGGEEEVPAEGEEPIADEEVDVAVDEVDEESLDGLGESYFKRVYENVNGFKTTSVKQRGNSLIIEGKIKFSNGKVRKTSFMFEALDATKNGRVRFVGDNKNLTEGKKAFMLTGKMKGNKLIAESLNYNYKHKDANGKVSRVYGTERTSRR